MPFNSSLPEWNKTATAPTQTKKDAGWAAEEKPPASIFNWFFNTAYLAIKELQEEAINSDQKGVNNGVAPLDATGDLPLVHGDNILNWVKGFGLGDVAKDVSSTDVNNLDATGFYKGQTLTNAPNASAGWFYIINIKHNATYKQQIAFQFTGGTANVEFTRQNNNGTWTSWVQTAQYDATGKVAIANLPDATTAAKGISQLNDTITSTSTSQAATANAVKQVVDWVKGFGLGDIAKDVSSTDLNNLDATGLYKGTTLTNAPGGVSSAFFILHFKASTTVKTQLAIRYNQAATDSYYWFRHNISGTWGGWIQIASYDSNGKVAVANLPAATTAAAGIAQLADSISDTSTTKAATANAVKLAVDWVKGFGIGGTAPTVADLNTVTATGFYATTGGTTLNSPTANNANVIHLNRDGTRPTQILIDYFNNNTYIRSNSGTWSAWTQIETTTGAQTKADTAETNALNWAKGFGLGTNAKILTNTDANALDATGFYYIDGASSLNTPTPGTSGYYIVNIKNSATFKMQIAYNISTGAAFQRVNNSGTWSAWTTDASQEWVKSFGLGDVAKDITSTDLNALDATGFYRGQTLTNAPGASTGLFYVLNIKHSATYKTQSAVSFSSGIEYKRNNNNGTWTSWVQTAQYDATGKIAVANLPDIAINKNTFGKVNVNGSLLTADFEIDQFNMFPGAGISFSSDSPSNAMTISLQNPTWTNLTLQNGATVFSSRTPRYTIVGNEVIVEGEINGVSTVNVVIGTLPTGFRPPTTRLFKVAQNWTTSNDGATVFVNTDGTITVQTLASVSQSISLMGIRFFIS
jgi:hypothetical protein